jgi:hypothetical protein
VSGNQTKRRLIQKLCAKKGPGEIRAIVTLPGWFCRDDFNFGMTGSIRLRDIKAGAPPKIEFVPDDPDIRVEHLSAGTCTAFLIPLFRNYAVW